MQHHPIAHDLNSNRGALSLEPASSTRQVLLDAARALLLRRGPAATAMQDVAQRAGLSRRTLYNQFADRDCLFDAVIEGLVGQIAVDTAPLGDVREFRKVVNIFAVRMDVLFAQRPHRDLLAILGKTRKAAWEQAWQTRIVDPTAVVFERHLLRMALDGLPIHGDIAGELARAFCLLRALASSRTTTVGPLIDADELGWILATRLTRKTSGRGHTGAAVARHEMA